MTLARRAVARSDQGTTMLSYFDPGGRARSARARLSRSRSGSASSIIFAAAAPKRCRYTSRRTLRSARSVCTMLCHTDLAPGRNHGGVSGGASALASELPERYANYICHSSPPLSDNFRYSIDSPPQRQGVFWAHSAPSVVINIEPLAQTWNIVRRALPANDGILVLANSAILATWLIRRRSWILCLR